MEQISPTLKAIKDEMARQEIGVIPLADLAGIAASTLYRMLDGEADPHLSTIETLQGILKIRYKRVKK